LLHIRKIDIIIFSWQQFGNNHSVGRNNHCNLYKNMPHIGMELKQNKLIQFRDIKSSNKQKCLVNPVFWCATRQVDILNIERFLAFAAQYWAAFLCC